MKRGARKFTNLRTGKQISIVKFWKKIV